VIARAADSVLGSFSECRARRSMGAIALLASAERFRDERLNILVGRGDTAEGIAYVDCVDICLCESGLFHSDRRRSLFVFVGLQQPS